MLTLLLIFHILGSVLGVGGATMVEIFFNKSIRDGFFDPTERSFMKTTVRVVRTGLLISVITGLGLILLYRFNDQVFRLYDPLLWAKFSILFFLMINAVLLQLHKIPIQFGSAISFVSWYSVFILGFLVSGPPYPYSLIMSYYFLALIIGGIILEIIRRILGINLKLRP
jgi:hypothetical protein